MVFGADRKTMLMFFSLQLNCCGKGTVTNFFTRFTDSIGHTSICPSSGTSFVSAIINVCKTYHSHTAGNEMKEEPLAQFTPWKLFEFILVIGQKCLKSCVDFSHTSLRPYVNTVLFCVWSATLK